MAGYADLPPPYEVLEPRDTLDPYMAAAMGAGNPEKPSFPQPDELQQYLAAAYWLQEQIYTSINTYQEQQNLTSSSTTMTNTCKSPEEAFDQLPIDKQQVILQIIQELPPAELEHMSSTLSLRSEVTQYRQEYYRDPYRNELEQAEYTTQDVFVSSKPPGHSKHEGKQKQKHRHKHRRSKSRKNDSSPTGERPPSPKSDEVETRKMTRFFGDTLMGRMARAGVGTTTAAVKNFRSLSPWGDNNPVIMPNVRYRDIILTAAFSAAGGPMVEGIDTLIHDAFGSDSFVSEIVSSGADAIKGNIALKYAVFQVVEQAIDVGIIEHMLPEEDKLITTEHIKTLRVQVKHKLMGIEAGLRFTGTRPTRDPGAYDKGWFCPYLFASGRTPTVPRAVDFSIAELTGPFIKSDASLATTLLAESAAVLSLCDPDPNHSFPTARMVLFFTAIAPFRAGMWSTSRRPGCGTLHFHLFDGCPALVVPVRASPSSPRSISTASPASSSSSSSSFPRSGSSPSSAKPVAPVLAWSPWTLRQMLHPAESGYEPVLQHREICEWLDGILDVGHVEERLRSRYDEVLGRCVSLVINGALGLGGKRELLKGRKVDLERAGVVALRF